MQRWLLAIVFVVVFAALAAAQEKPDVAGVSLWERITVLSPYTGWGQFPDHTGMQPGRAPHGPKHKVFVNRTGLQTGQPKSDGTIIVKENYTKDEKLAAITVMYKVKGYNPDAGDWFWVKFAPDGTAQAQGTPKGCVNCHRVRADHDFIMVSDF